MDMMDSQIYGQQPDFAELAGGSVELAIELCG
jgi:hypothetical protein